MKREELDKANAIVSETKGKLNDLKSAGQSFDRFVARLLRSADCGHIVSAVHAMIEAEGKNISDKRDKDLDAI